MRLRKAKVSHAGPEKVHSDDEFILRFVEDTLLQADEKAIFSTPSTGQTVGQG